MRYVFGPEIRQVTVPPVGPGPQPGDPANPGKLDVSVTAEPSDARRVADGTATVTVSIGIPDYDLATHHRLLEVHALFFPIDQNAPATPEACLASSAPQAMADVSALNRPAVVNLDVTGIKFDRTVGKTILGFEDAANPTTAPGPAVTTAPAA